MLTVTDELRLFAHIYIFGENERTNPAESYSKVQYNIVSSNNQHLELIMEKDVF